MRVLSSLAIIALLVFVNVFPWPAPLADAVFTNGTLPVVNAFAQTWSKLAISPTIIVLAALTLALFTPPRWRILGVALAILALSFPFFFSLGYRTSPLEARLLLPETSLPPESLALYVMQLSATTTADHADRSTRLERAARCVHDFLHVTDLFPAWQAPHMRVVPNGWLLRFGVSGFINPFTHEPHVDGELPGWYFEHVARHEFAHTAGFSREAEAEAVALLAGITCTDPAAQYTGAVALASWVMNETALPITSLSPQVRDDLHALQAALETFTQPQLAEVQSQVYSQYLQVQGEEGLHAYARATSIVARALTVDACVFTRGCAE